MPIEKKFKILSIFQVFREHNIDGSALPLLTEDHLTLRLGLKLGPALKLRSLIAKKLGPTHADICVHCAHCSSTKSNDDAQHLKESHATSLSNGGTTADQLSEELRRSVSRNSSVGDK